MAGKTIIILEDDDDLRDHYRLVLEAEGYDIVGAANSENILGLITEHSPVLVITDLYMPEHSGSEAILKIINNNNTPIIAVSAFDHMIDSIEYLVDAHMLKPVSNNALVGAVKAVLEKKQARKRK